MRLARPAAAVFAGLFAVVLTAGPAAAHVTVNPSEATQGGFAKLAFRVPNERANAGTVGLEVVFPADAPIPNASVKPLAGWKATVSKVKADKPIQVHGTEVTDRVDKIVWTADSPANAITAGQFQEFEVSAGPLPEVDKIIFKSLQTYSNDEIVRWIDEPVASGEEPEHPAPVLTLAAGESGEHASDSGTSRDWLAVGLGGGALVVALGALGLALRKRPTP